jgi:hypothetical protein
MGMLCMPPYHSELNTREKQWIVVKNSVVASNVTFRLQDVEKLTKDKFSLKTTGKSMS